MVVLRDMGQWVKARCVASGGELGPQDPRRDRHVTCAVIPALGKWRQGIRSNDQVPL